jgi:hypothetical protein
VSFDNRLPAREARAIAAWRAAIAALYEKAVGQDARAGAPVGSA